MNQFKLTLLILWASVASVSFAVEIPTSPKAERSISNVELSLKEALAEKGLKYGAPIFIRIFKEPAILEVWLESSDGSFVNFKNYDICTFSGNIGPKLKEGDNQSPEGFYFVNASRLNPWSRFHLSFNLGYPNKYDRAYGRTGSALMVHGNCVSIGCYAMTDSYMSEIYALSVAALKAGQPFFRVHSFPFHLEPDTLEKYRFNKWHSFWLNLKVGYDHFNKYKRPPNVEVSNGVYLFDQ
ncbi:MAG: murein L,D-transpeptidase [Alteromonadales bacterium]|nr:murein L,D-transpeptidase [Alteromonadales bacterium]